MAHSVATLALTTGYAIPKALEFQNSLAAEAQNDADDLHRFLKQAVAAVPTGIAAGYASHLIGDATTPRSIPLLGKFRR